MKHPSTQRGLLIVLFAAYTVLLTWAVMWKFGTPYMGSGSALPIKLLPFLPTDDAGGSAPLEVVANVVMFVPFGFYLRVVAPTWPAWIAVCTVALASVTFEALQYAWSTGVPDISDVVANTTGGLIGIRLGGRVANAGPRRALGVAAGSVLIALGALLASPQHLSPPGDVGPLSCTRTSSATLRQMKPGCHSRILSDTAEDPAAGSSPRHW